jgi:hypothetical protein
MRRKSKKQQEKQKKYNNAPICKHCAKNYPSTAEDECRALNKIKTLAHQHGNPTKAIDGARGPS